MEIARLLPQFHIIEQDIREGRCIQLEGCVPSQTEELITELGRDFEFVVIVAEDETKAAGMLNNYAAFDRDVCIYPARDPMFHKADIQGSYLTDQRIAVTQRIYEGKHCAIITTLEAFFDELDTMEHIEKSVITVRTGDAVDGKELAGKLVDMGYENESQVSGRGEFSVRGNIIDIYPYASRAPYRIDLFGDEIESIKIFDTESQRSVEAVEEFMIFPGGDGNNEPNGSEGSSFLEYFRNKRVLFVVCEPVRILKNMMGMNPLASVDESGEMGEVSFTREKFEKAEKMLGKIAGRASIMLSSIGSSSESISIYRNYQINARNIPSYNGRFLEMVEDLKKYRKNGYRVIIECAGETRAENMVRNLADNGVTVGKIEADPLNKVAGSEILVKAGAVRVGFEYPEIKFSLITEVDIFGARKNKKKKKRYTGDPIREFTDLSIGDYVVHEQHGVGIYQGIERIKVDGSEKDYMKISYAKNACLYVLATQFDKIQKYGGGDGARPKINKLGGKEWGATKAKVKAAVQDIAQDLVRLYSSRQLQNGFRYSEDTVWQTEFEDSFEFEETDDQIKAIDAVKADMESGKIMDRLICGDVGFGKTEIAIRAAFKAVQDGKQVAFLTPTTILAQQHFNTLCRRLENYPVTIKMMSRFQTGSQQSGTLREMANGQADIVVGTHRLLSKDIRFKDLGLLIIDEEQRFGVAHKEKIKQLRENIDVLTLSATPIPRTLHMSLTGIRDMSLLTEPPVDRLPIQTYVMEYSDEAVKEAVSREIARGGQVYYVYNRTGNIDLIADNIRQLVPFANVTYAHGKMSSRELENIMFDFIDGQIDVLVSTTIIETGLDIPNVNTIIIHDADNFGLSQLYQLRGRVGRSSRTSYAFLMYKKDKLIREVAEKRLKAIREFSDLGSGIKIAMRDLEIRGAGNVLGAEQSGHMDAVGYELYCKMLNEAVAVLKGEKEKIDFETTVDLDIDGFIPGTYIVNEFEKLNMYKRISAISCTEELDDIKTELEDRFGVVPTVTLNLLLVALIKARAHERYVLEITNAKPHMYSGKNMGVSWDRDRKVFKITILGTAPIDTYKMLTMLRDRTDELKFVNEKDPYFFYAPVKSPKSLKEIMQTLDVFFDILNEIIDKNGVV